MRCYPSIHLCIAALGLTLLTVSAETQPARASSNTWSPRSTSPKVQGEDQEGSQQEPAARGPWLGSPAVIATVQEEQLDEISGIAASSVFADTLYVHNDSGDSARFFAISTAGKTLAEFGLEGASVTDCEDIAVGPGPDGSSYVYLGDIGDNAARTGLGTPRKNIKVFSVPESELSLVDGSKRALKAWSVRTLAYPDAPHDCEALLVDPTGGGIFLITKEPRGIVHVYRLPEASASGATETLELVGTIKLAGQLVTAGAFAPDGSALILRTYSRVLHWPRAKDASVMQALQLAPTALKAPLERQGEAITFSRTGDRWLTVSEGANPRIFAATRLPK